MRCEFIIVAGGFSLAEAFVAPSGTFAVVCMFALMRSKRVLTLIDLAFVFHFLLFVIRAIGVADTIVHFCAADSVTSAFIIAFAAARTRVVKVLIDHAHVWLRVGCAVLLFLFLFAFAARRSSALAPVVAPSEAFTFVI